MTLWTSDINNSKPTKVLRTEVTMDDVSLHLTGALTRKGGGIMPMLRSNYENHG